MPDGLELDETFINPPLTDKEREEAAESQRQFEVAKLSAERFADRTLLKRETWQDKDQFINLRFPRTSRGEVTCNVQLGIEFEYLVNEVAQIVGWGPIEDLTAFCNFAAREATRAWLVATALSCALEGVAIPRELKALRRKAVQYGAGNAALTFEDYLDPWTFPESLPVRTKLKHQDLIARRYQYSERLPAVFAGALPHHLLAAAALVWFDEAATYTAQGNAAAAGMRVSAAALAAARAGARVAELEMLAERDWLDSHDGRALAERKNAKLRRVKEHMISLFLQGKFKNAAQAAFALKDEAFQKARKENAPLTESNMQRTLHQWFLGAQRARAAAVASNDSIPLAPQTDS